MANLIIDEWLWADLAGDNRDEKQRESFQFLEAVFTKCDRFVTVKGSAFYRKAFDFWKHEDVVRRAISRFYRAKFSLNLSKSLMLDEAQLADLPADIAEEVKPDDRYLVQACLTSGRSPIVTTDGPLMRVLQEHGITCEHRDKFVPDYIAKYGQQQTV